MTRRTINNGMVTPAAMPFPNWLNAILAVPIALLDARDRNRANRKAQR